MSFPKDSGGFLFSFICMSLSVQTVIFLTKQFFSRHFDLFLTAIAFIASPSALMFFLLRLNRILALYVFCVQFVIKAHADCSFDICFSQCSLVRQSQQHSVQTCTVSQ